MSSYQIDSDTVIATSGSAQACMGRVSAEVATLMGQLTSLEGSWTGQAATAFQGVVQSWRATQQQVEENMAMIQQALTLAAQQYADIEAANARLFPA